ncbi:trans-sulfuration enzyme family protein [Leadbettera azotonutricia]|uniref:cysteine-S-conjugate beta-lyase n=1 Tax=Leadbettera azotonutricia (strain ATCC BAA-888 / DSM 13862 / ZAS-9) TaxID=545695 RepID=F5YFY9_LEAAZ|nr:PLP-dependent aspartate aminotransferase family protein [Leadbettera azotonutricia]AEF81798.1 cystathionine gamma-synthase [Leadbettera azotonutricia ZAS-9]
MDFGTLLIHNGHEADPTTGALGVTLYQTSTFDQGNAYKDAIDSGSVSPQEYDYARSGNPTRKALEETIASLERGARGFAFGSGIAAVSSVLGIFKAGDHIVAAEDIYGGSWRILNTFYKRWGLEMTPVDASDSKNVKKAIRPNTKAIFLETPSNPLLKITDLKACFTIAKEAGLISIVDNTFMTPLLQRPIELGADIVIHSATKFLGGHSDVISGLAVTKTEELGKQVYAVQNGFGAVPGPWDVWLVIRGIKTLKVRLEAQEKGAKKIAAWLSSHKNVEAVYYPGLENHPGKQVNDAQASGAGAVFSFKTKTLEQARKFLGTVKLAAAAVSLGGVETIASYPVAMSHASIPQNERERLGITDTLIRISVGLENPDDLIADFDEALA